MPPVNTRCAECGAIGPIASAPHRPDCKTRAELAAQCADLVWFRARPGRFWRTREPFDQEIWRLKRAGWPAGQWYPVDVTAYGDGVHVRRFRHGCSGKLIAEVRDRLVGFDHD